MRLRESSQASAASPAASSTAMRTRIGSRADADGGGAAVTSVSAIKICYQPLDELVVTGARNQHLRNAQAAGVGRDARMRHEERRLGEVLAALASRHGEEIV